MKKCVACEFYDRNDADTQENGVRWGKCRRTGPIVHPLSAKSYLVEGVWPNVRDDDWCGEWVLSNRSRPDNTAIAAMNSLMMQSAQASPRVSPAVSAMSPATPATSAMPPTSGMPPMAAMPPIAARPALASPTASADAPVEPVHTAMSGLMRGSLQSG